MVNHLRESLMLWLALGITSPLFSETPLEITTYLERPELTSPILTRSTDTLELFGKSSAYLRDFNIIAPCSSVLPITYSTQKEYWCTALPTLPYGQHAFTLSAHDFFGNDVSYVQTVIREPNLNFSKSIHYTFANTPDGQGGWGLGYLIADREINATKRYQLVMPVQPLGLQFAENYSQISITLNSQNRPQISIPLTLDSPAQKLSTTARMMLIMPWVSQKHPIITRDKRSLTTYSGSIRTLLPITLRQAVVNTTLDTERQIIACEISQPGDYSLAELSGLRFTRRAVTANVGSRVKFPVYVSDSNGMGIEGAPVTVTYMGKSQTATTNMYGMMDFFFILPSVPTVSYAIAECEGLVDKVPLKTVVNGIMINDVQRSTAGAGLTINGREIVMSPSQSLFGDGPSGELIIPTASLAVALSITGNVGVFHMSIDHIIPGTSVVESIPLTITQTESLQGNVRIAVNGVLPQGKSVLTGYYVSEEGNVQLLPECTMQADWTSPVIKRIAINQRPVNDGMVLDHRMTFQLTASDNIGISRTKMIVDGQEIANRAWTQNQGTMTIPVPALSEGTHTLSLSVTDFAGLVSTRTMQVKSVAGLSVVGHLLMYPNPVRKTADARIQYELTQSADLTLTVKDVYGRTVQEWPFIAGSEGGQAGINRIVWSNHMDMWGNRLGSGIYTLILRQGSTVLGKSRFTVVND